MLFFQPEGPVEKQDIPQDARGWRQDGYLSKQDSSVGPHATEVEKEIVSEIEIDRQIDG